MSRILVSVLPIFKLWSLTLLAAFPLCFGCTQSEKRTRSVTVHPATYGMELFQVERDPPKREKNNAEFYFKKCTLNEQKPFTNEAEFDCSYP